MAETSGINFKRHIYTHLKDHLDSFIESKSGSKWIIMSGLRGVGKTTLLAPALQRPSDKRRSPFLFIA